jgi:zinc protease
MVYLSPPHRENRLRPYHVTFSASPAGQVPAGYPVLQNQLATADTVNATSSQQQWKSPLGYTVTQFTLGNGHKLLVEERPTTNFIALRTFVDAGSILENAVLPSPHYNDINLPSGIAHLDEHCRFLTTEHFPVKNTWTQAVNNMGSRWNASTSPEVIQHELFFNREDLPRMLQLHAESILRPTYNQTDLPQEKRNVINEATLRTRKPGSKIYNKLSELLFSRPDDQTLGLEQDVSRTTPVDLQYFRQLAYAPKNMVTLVSGNVNPDEVRRILEPELLKNPVKNRVINTPSTKLTLQPNQILSAVVTDPQLSNSVVSFAFPAPSRSSFKERVAMEFI